MIYTRMIRSLVLALALVAVAAGPGAAMAAEGHGGGEAAHGASGDTGLNPLTWNRDLALWSGVVFVILLLVLGKFAWGPIADGLDKREKRIADEIAAAERSNADAKQLLDDYQRKLAASEEQVRQMIEAAKRDAEKVGQGIVEKARTEADRERQRAVEEIDLAAAGAMKDLAERSATLAVDLAGKIVGSHLDPAAHKRLVEQSLAGLGNSSPRGR